MTFCLLNVYHKNFLFFTIHQKIYSAFVGFFLFSFAYSIYHLLYSIKFIFSFFKTTSSSFLLLPEELLAKLHSSLIGEVPKGRRGWSQRGAFFLIHTTEKNKTMKFYTSRKRKKWKNIGQKNKYLHHKNIK